MYKSLSMNERRRQTMKMSIAIRYVKREIWLTCVICFV